MQVTPLQLAVVYSALANGGTIVTPHLGLDVQTADGTVLRSVQPAAAAPHQHRPDCTWTRSAPGCAPPPRSRAAPRTTCSGNFPEQVYGKTGTAQYNGQQDYAWYACFVPPSATTKPIVVVVTVEQGGFGDVGAAPVARQILSQWFFGNPGSVHGRELADAVSARRRSDRPSRSRSTAPPRPRALPADRSAACSWPRSGWSPARCVTLKGATRR